LKSPGPILGHDYCDTWDRICSTFLMMTMIAYVFSARLPQRSKSPILTWAYLTFFLFSSIGVLSQVTLKGSGPGLVPPSQADILLLRLHSEHIWCWCKLDLSEPTDVQEWLANMWWDDDKYWSPALKSWLTVSKDSSNSHLFLTMTDMDPAVTTTYYFSWTPQWQRLRCLLNKILGWGSALFPPLCLRSRKRICPFLSASVFFPQICHSIFQLCLPIASLNVHHRSLVSCYEIRFSVLFIEVQDKGCLMSCVDRSLTACSSRHALTYTQQNTILYIICLH
jgi:immunoglobulin heavy chain